MEEKKKNGTSWVEGEIFLRLSGISSVQCVLKLSSSHVGILDDHMRGIKGELIIY